LNRLKKVEVRFTPTKPHLVIVRKALQKQPPPVTVDAGLDAALDHGAEGGQGRPQGAQALLNDDSVAVVGAVDLSKSDISETKK